MPAEDILAIGKTTVTLDINSVAMVSRAAARDATVTSCRMGRRAAPFGDRAVGRLGVSLPGPPPFLTSHVQHGEALVY